MCDEFPFMGQDGLKNLLFRATTLTTGSHQKQNLLAPLDEVGQITEFHQSHRTHFRADFEWSAHSQRTPHHVSHTSSSIELFARRRRCAFVHVTEDAVTL